MKTKICSEVQHSPLAIVWIETRRLASKALSRHERQNQDVRGYDVAMVNWLSQVMLRSMFLRLGNTVHMPYNFSILAWNYFKTLLKSNILVVFSIFFIWALGHPFLRTVERYFWTTAEIFHFYKKFFSCETWERMWIVCELTIGWSLLVELLWRYSYLRSYSHPPSCLNARVVCLSVCFWSCWSRLTANNIQRAARDVWVHVKDLSPCFLL
jgi:hypothetical protein